MGYVFPSYAFIIVGSACVAFPIGILLYQLLCSMKHYKKLAKHIKDNETSEDKALIREIDEELNTYSVKRIVEYFLILGVASFLSMCVTFVGVLHETTNSNILTSNIPSLVGVFKMTTLYNV